MIQTKELSELRAARRAKVDLVTSRMKVWQVEKQKVLSGLKEKKGETVSELASWTGFPPASVLKYILALRKSNIVSETGIKGDEYVYRLVSAGGGE